MGPTKAKYKPLHASEKLLPLERYTRSDGSRGTSYLGCSLSAGWGGTALATLGGSTLDATGRLMSKRARTAVLKRGWRAFKRKYDSNGIPDTDDHRRIHGAMFPPLPIPEQLWTRDWDLVMDHLKAGEAISIALRLSIFGASNPIDHTSADHQVTMWDRVAGDKTNVLGPMRPHSDSYSGHTASLDALKRASKAISGGLILTWLYPIGGWTEAALVEGRLKERLRSVRAERNTAETKLEVAEKRLDRKVGVIADLRKQLDQASGGDPLDCDDAVAEARQDAIEDEMEALGAYARARTPGTIA